MTRCSYDVQIKFQNKIWIFEDEDTSAVVRKSLVLKEKWNQMKLYKILYLDKQKTVKDSYMYTKSNLLKTYEPIKELTLGTLIILMNRFTDQKPASTIWPMQDLNCLNTLLADFVLLFLVKMEIRKRQFSRDKGFMRAGKMSC